MYLCVYISIKLPIYTRYISTGCGLPNIYSPSRCPPPLPLYLRTTTVALWRCTWSSVFEMRLETKIEWTERCTSKPSLREFGDALGDWDRVNSEMHLEAGIEQVWRCTWRPWSCELAGCNGGSLEIHLEAVIEPVWKCTWRPWSSQFGDALGGHARANLQAVMERVWWYTWRLWLSEYGDALGGHDRARLDVYLEAVDGRRTWWWDSIHQLVNSQPWECDNETLPLSSHGELADGDRSCREVRRKLKLHSGVNS